MMGAPMGQQDRLFYEFCLDDVVPADHLLRKIDAVLDLGHVPGCGVGAVGNWLVEATAESLA